MSKVLGLRTCNADMTSHGGFVWPESGYVEAPDWDGGKPVCGGKLHFFLWGEGNGSLANWGPDAVWLVVAADESEVVEITEDGGGKHGFRRGEVVYRGGRDGATAYILANGAAGKAVIGAMVSAGNYGTATAGYSGTATSGYSGTATAGDNGTATAGDNSTATAGDKGTATAGDYGTATVGYKGTATVGYKGTATVGYEGTATAGYEGTAIAGDKGTATAGNYGTAIVGDKGTATVGYRGTATAGDEGTATAGNYGTAIVGDYGTAIVGDYGTATVGYRGTATAGDKGVISILWGNGGKYRHKIGCVGEDGLKAYTEYRVEDGEFVEVDPFGRVNSD